MSIPTLYTLEIMKLQSGQSNHIYETIQSISGVGCSSVTELHLPVCEPPTLALSNFFKWPRHLRSLKIWICWAQHNSCSDRKRFSVQEVLTTLSGLSSTLEDLEMVFELPKHYRHETNSISAFEQFTRLRRLVTSADVVASKTRIMRSMDNHTFYTNFPPCLEDLTLMFEDDRRYNRALQDNMHKIIYSKPDDLDQIISKLFMRMYKSDR